MTLRAPRRELEHEALAHADHREGLLLARELEAHHRDVEVDARGDVVDLEYHVIDDGHR